jgi:hypothetical protein
MQNINNCDLLTLFTFRFALDQANTVVNLKLDILDLQSFPERLEVSYEAEWRTYVKRAMHNIEKSPVGDKASLEKSISALLDGHSDEFNEQLRIVKTAMAVNNSTEVTVINTPLKTYVQNLLNL